MSNVVVNLPAIVNIGFAYGAETIHFLGKVALILCISFLGASLASKQLLFIVLEPFWQ